MDEETRVQVAELFNSIKYTDNGGHIFNDETKLTIKALAVKMRTSALYRRMYKKRRESIQRKWYSFTPEKVYKTMLERVLSAPLSVLAESAVTLILPILDDRLDGREELTPPTEMEVTV